MYGEVVFGITLLWSRGDVEVVETVETQARARGEQPSSLVGVSSSILLCCCDDNRAPRDGTVMLMTWLDMRVASHCKTLAEVNREVSLKSGAKKNVVIISWIFYLMIFFKLFLDIVTLFFILASLLHNSVVPCICCRATYNRGGNLSEYRSVVSGCPKR